MSRSKTESGTFAPQFNEFSMRWLRDTYNGFKYRSRAHLIALRLLLDHEIGTMRALPPVALTQFELARLLRAMERSGQITNEGKERLLVATGLGVHPKAKRKMKSCL